MFSHQPWYHGNITRSTAEDLLSKAGKDGSFLLRDSESIQGAYALCVLWVLLLYLSGGRAHMLPLLLDETWPFECFELDCGLNVTFAVFLSINLHEVTFESVIKLKHARFLWHTTATLLYIYIYIHKGLWKCISFLESFYKTEAYLFANSQFPCFLANCSVCVVLLKCALWMQWNISPVWFLVSWIINKQCWLRLKEVGEGFPIITAFSKMTLFTVYVWIVTFDMKFVLICIMFLFFSIFTFAGTRTVCIPTEYYQMRTKNYQSR